MIYFLESLSKENGLNFLKIGTAALNLPVDSHFKELFSVIKIRI